MTSTVRSLALFNMLPIPSRAPIKDGNVDLSCQKRIHAANLPEAIQRALNTYYKTPMPAPSEITAINLDGFRVRWDDLSYSSQCEIISRNYKGGCTSLCLPYEGPSFCEATIPRWTHGQMHATRAALLVRMVANMYNEFQPTVRLSEEEIVLAQFLAAFHDSARQAEGVDIWDDESAGNIYEQMNEFGFSEKEIFEGMRYLAQKDHDGEDKHIISKLIQSADCLDIMRIYGVSGFNNSYLDIFNDLSGNLNFVAELESFKKEYYRFIKKTENPLLKLHLETQSKNCFKETQSLMLMNGSDGPKFPLLTKWTAQSSKEPRKSLKLVFEANIYRTLGDFFILKDIKSGTHNAYVLEDKKGALFFFKELESMPSQLESCSSKIATNLTAGLVPQADVVQIGSKTGVIQPYLELEAAPFKAPGGFDPSKLTFQQQKELFSHMIADFAIYNYDAHTGQFAIDTDGKVIGYDKGEAFACFNKSSPCYFPEGQAVKFNPEVFWMPLGSDQPTYKIFSGYLKNNPSRSADILASSEVKAVFMKTTSSLEFSTLKKIELQIPGSKLRKQVIKRLEIAEESIKNYFS
ncbi:MAG: hypothetical protein S4CHLAM6_13400 [Chlamydiae bacterium]|nr:hypothetical protein [Chlamydiota bacterium]